MHFYFILFIKFNKYSKFIFCPTLFYFVYCLLFTVSLLLMHISYQCAKKNFNSKMPCFLFVDSKKASRAHDLCTTEACVSFGKSISCSKDFKTKKRYSSILNDFG